MAIYEQLKREYDKLEKVVSENAGDSSEELRSFIENMALKIWGSNELYSPDYAKAVKAITGEEKNADQIKTAMACCADPKRKIIIPDFFKKIVTNDSRSKGTEAELFLTMFNDFMVSIAYINGDFTIEEARALTDIMKQLNSFATTQGDKINAKAIEIKKQTTEIRKEAYVGIETEGVQEGTSEDTHEGSREVPVEIIDDIPDEDGNILVNVKLDLGPVGVVDHEMKINPEDFNHSDDEDSDCSESDFAKPVEVQKPQEPASESELSALLNELDSLVGMDNVKQDVHSLMNFIKVSRMREERGMKVPTISYHLVFTGNPGTGKTTVARLVAKLYYQMGILSGGQLVETDRSALVAGYTGQTALKTQKVIKSALGGVLFIDEAYSLANDEQDGFGKEAIETILKAMEDHRDELVVIVAGYTDLMHKFIDSNPGLSSRFSKYFEFSDYNGDEMLKIFHRFCEQNGFDIEPETEGFLQEKFNDLFESRDEHFGNARTVRNIFEKAINNQANRLADLDKVTDKDLELITMGDLEDAVK